MFLYVIFFCSSRRRHTRWPRDWSSDVCSSDLVTTFSTGNHGLAVAYVAKRLGIKAVICISNRVPQAKVERIKRMGAEVIKVGTSQDEAENYCYQLEQEKGLTVIKPFDDPYVIAGQGTIGLEMIEHVPLIDTAIVQVSGGGLFSGIGLVLKHYNPNIRLIGVSMEKSAVMYESLRVNKPEIGRASCRERV